MGDRLRLQELSGSAASHSVPAGPYKSPDGCSEIVELYGPRLHYGDVSIDWCRGSVSTANASVTLLRTELRLFGALLESAGEPIPSRVLIRSTWPEASYELTKYFALRACVQSLRRRLKLVGASRKLLSVRGIGYRLVP
jgi:DNA-binding response OmpR family regulator